MTVHQGAALTSLSKFFSQAQVLTDAWSTLTSRGRSREAERIVQELRRGATLQEFLLVRLVIMELDSQLTRLIDERREWGPKGDGDKAGRSKN